MEAKRVKIAVSNTSNLWQCRWAKWKHELTTLQANGINLKSEIRMFLERWRMRESNMKRFAQLYQIQAKCRDDGQVDDIGKTTVCVVNLVCPGQGSPMANWPNRQCLAQMATPNIII